MRGHQRVSDPSRQTGPFGADRLLKITSAIAHAVSSAEVYEALVDQVAEVIGASSAGLWLIDDTGRTAHLARARGYTDETREHLAVLPLSMAPSVPVLDALRSGEPVWLHSQAALLERYPHLRSLITPEREYRISCLPLITQGRIVGSLGFTVEQPGAFHRDERGFLLLVAGYAGQAIERLRLFESERRSRHEANAALKRLEVLSRASRAFVSSGLERDARLRQVVSELSAVLDSCVHVSLIGPDGLLHVVAVDHPDPGAHQMLETLARFAPVHLGEGVAGTIAVTGESAFLPSIEQDMLAAKAAPAYRAFLEKFPAYALIGVALCVRGQVVGTVTATRCRVGETYTGDDLRLLEDLADRAAVAIENSRLYQDAIDARARAERLYEFAQSIVDASKIDAVFGAAADAIEAVLGTQRSAILTFDDSGQMRFRAWRNLSDAYRRAVEGHSPWSREATAPQPILVPNVGDEPTMASFRTVFGNEGIVALAFIPLVSSGRLIGKFMVYYPEPHPFPPHEIETAQAIASHLASVINRFTAVAQLEETIRYNELFAGTLAHDLRNPLGAMMMGAHLVLQSSGDQEAIKSLRRILKSGDRMTRMIDQLLDFTRARLAGGIPLQKSTIDLSHVAKHTVDEIALTAAGRTFRLAVLGDLEGEWDGDRMAQVFSNLFGNAVEHGTPEQPIEVRLDGRDESSVSIEVHNGGAIPAHALPELFEPFRRAPQKRDGRRGLGLGLYITQQVGLRDTGSLA